ncbi:hypothetical protein MCC10014_0220 [Bifidobacterium longum subsp. longum]|nr:hypothetical protein MCC10014_0220 [Bifidobacterium longum subsp. longum]
MGGAASWASSAETKFKQAQASTRNAYESRITEGLADIAQALFQIDLRLDRLEKKLDGRG